MLAKGFFDRERRMVCSNRPQILDHYGRSPDTSEFWVYLIAKTIRFPLFYPFSKSRFLSQGPLWSSFPKYPWKLKVQRPSNVQSEQNLKLFLEQEFHLVGLLYHEFLQPTFTNNMKHCIPLHYINANYQSVWGVLLAFFTHMHRSSDKSAKTLLITKGKYMTR